MKEMKYEKKFIVYPCCYTVLHGETNNPFHPMTREEIIEQLSIAHEHADKGMIMEAHKASANIRDKYGLCKNGSL